MNLNAIPDNIWIGVIDGSLPVRFDFLGLQFFLTTLRQRMRMKELTQPVAINELKAYFAKNSALPSAQNDCKKIAQLGGIHV